MKVTAMTIGYFPFTMGGKVHRPICCEIEADSLHELGKGYKGYLITAPNGKTFVAEFETGAFVGPDIESVKKDIEKADTEVMDKQITKARKMAKEAQKLDIVKWWTMLKCTKKI